MTLHGVLTSASRAAGAKSPRSDARDGACVCARWTRSFSQGSQGEVRQKWAAKRRNFGCAGSGSCTAVGDPDENSVVGGFDRKFPRIDANRDLGGKWQP